MSKLRARWNGWPRGVRAGAVVGMVFLLAVVSVTFIDRATRGRPVSSADTQGSARSAATNGTKAFRLLLDRYQYPTTSFDRGLRRGISELPSTATLFVLDLSFPTDRERATVRSFAARGGRVVIGGADGAAWLTTDRPSPVQGTRRTVRVRLGEDFVVETGGTARWRGPNGPQLVVTRRIGGGEVLLVADDTPLQNARIGRRDNAGFALALAGTPSRVAFADPATGVGAGTGWAAVPFGWKVAIVGGAFALLLTATARGRRIGGAEPTGRALDPPRRATADVLAGGLERSRRPAAALSGLGAAARRHIIELADLEPDATGPQIVAAAIAAGWDPLDAAALVNPPVDRPAVLALGRAFARTQKGSA